MELLLALPSTYRGRMKTTQRKLSVGTVRSREVTHAGHTVRVMLVDDHDVVRSGLRALLGSMPDITVVAEAATEADAVAQAIATKPDVVVMDVRLAEGNGIEATREIRSRLPKTRVLMLTSFADDEAIAASVVAGAAGYVLKEVNGGEIVRSVRAVASGRDLLDPEVTRVVMERLQRQALHRRPARVPVSARGTDPRTDGDGQNEPPDRAGTGVGREDREELRVQRPYEVGRRATSRGRRVPRTAHRLTRVGRESRCPR